MFLELSHMKLDVFQVSKQFVLSCYKETKSFPAEEKFATEGCSRKSLTERKRFYEIARSSVVEIDAALEIAADLGYTSKAKLKELGVLRVRTLCFGY